MCAFTGLREDGKHEDKVNHIRMMLRFDFLVLELLPSMSYKTSESKLLLHPFT